MAAIPGLFPAEVTRQIMLETLAASIASTGHFPRPVLQDPPLSFALVSQEWQNISLNTPELWQSIRVDRSTPIIPPQLVRAWLTRATGLPRRIQMETSDPVRGEALLAVSMEFCAQWQDIGLALPLQSFSALVAHHGPFPLLRSLSLSICSGLIDGDETITIRDAPLLRKVTLKDFPFLALDMAWDQLTALDMTVQDAEPGISALQHCSNLEELRFLLVDQGRLPTITPFTLPSLLWLVTAGKNSILSFLTLPRLAQLDISGPGFSRNSMARLTEDLRGMVQRSESGSACPLQNLSFRMPPDGISAAEFEAFLRAVPPSVVDFRLTLHVRGALEMVGAVLRVPGVLPGMRTLRLTYDIKSVAGSESFDPLLEILRARREVVDWQATLKTFDLNLRSPSLLPTVARDKFIAFGEKRGVSITIEVTES